MLSANNPSTDSGSADVSPQCRQVNETTRKMYFATFIFCFRIVLVDDEEHGETNKFLIIFSYVISSCEMKMLFRAELHQTLNALNFLMVYIRFLLSNHFYICLKLLYLYYTLMIYFA